MKPSSAAPAEPSTPDVPGDDGGAPRVPLFGVAFDAVTQESLIDRIESLIDAGGSHWIATINVNLLCLAERDESYRDVLTGADVVTADGMPIVWMSRLRRSPLPGRVTGSDLLPPLARRGVEKGWRIYLAGGAEGVAERVAAVLAEHAPGVRIVGTCSPPHLDYDELIASEENAELIESIRAAKPHVLCMALGSPKQERWIAAHHADLEVPVAVGIGAAFDFLAGRQTRAPRWLRRTGLEWFYRMVRSPRRLLPRYARDAWTFTRLCLREVFGRSRR